MADPFIPVATEPVTPDRLGVGDKIEDPRGDTYFVHSVHRAGDDYVVGLVEYPGHPTVWDTTLRPRDTVTRILVDGSPAPRMPGSHI